MVISTKQANEIISEVAGEDVLPVVDYLKNKRNISEFKIAEDTSLEVNKTRNILYRLHKHNIVTYHRKKDRIKGWYISYWTLNPGRVSQIKKQLSQRRLDQLKEKLHKEEQNQNSFFLCPNLCVRQDFDQATEFEFRCPECGNLLQQQDNSKTIDNLKNQIQIIESELAKEEYSLEYEPDAKTQEDKPAKKEKKAVKKAAKKKAVKKK